MGAEFAKIGDDLLDFINKTLSKHPRKQSMRQLKNKHIIILTYGVNTQRRFQFREKRQLKRRGQLPHLDSPAVIRELPPGMVPFLSVFVTMTERSETSYYFDWGLDELLQGKTWGVDEKTNNWILRRLYFAHRCAFEMQADLNKEAERTGKWRVCKPGNVNFFRPDHCWHAGMEGLNESKLPEVLLLFQFAWEPIADFFNKNFDANGGFGQYAWDAQIAGWQLEEVQQRTYDFSQVSLSGGL